MNKKVTIILSGILIIAGLVLIFSLIDKEQPWDTSVAKSEIISIDDETFGQISTYDKDNKLSYDKEGNVIACKEVPYYAFIERESTLNSEWHDRFGWDKVDWLKDEKEIEEIMKTYRTASDNEDFLIVDYKNGVAIVKYQGDDKKVVIPATLDGKPVIKLGYHYWYNDFPEGTVDDITYFSDPAFSSYEIEKIYLPTNLKYIADGSLVGISVEVCPNNPYYTCIDGVLYNKDKTVLLTIAKNNKQKALRIPDTVKTVYKIVGIKTEKVYVPASVEKICDLGEYSFYVFDTNLGDEDVIPPLKSIVVNSKNKYYSSKNGRLYNKGGTKLILNPSILT